MIDGHHQDDDYIYIPYKNNIKDDVDMKQNIQYQFYGELRQYQKEAIEQIKNKKYGIISIPPGWGKTVIGIYSIVNTIKLKTLIIVHTDVLLNQWIQRIKNYTDITPGIIKGKIQQHRDVTIGMIQTITQKYSA